MTERKSFEIDEELRDFLPAVPEMTDQQLEQNLIATGGPKDKLRVWLERNVLVDGHRRFGICQKLGLPYEVEYLSFPNKDAAKLWMLVYQLSRRNVVATQHQLLIAMLHDLQAKVLGTQAAAEKVATETGVSERTVYRAKDYKSALESLSEEIQEKIRAKTIKTSMESVIALANLSPVHQLAVIANVESGLFKSLAAALKTPDNESDNDGSRDPAADSKGAENDKGSDSVGSAAGSSGSTDSLSVKTYSDDFDTGKISGPKPTDAFGNSVPAVMESEFRFAAELEAQRKKLSSIKTWMTQNQNHPGAKILASAAQRVRTDIDHADSELKFAKPYCVCVYCDDKAGRVQDCKACKGLGWIPQPIFDSAPDKLKRKRKADAT